MTGERSRRARRRGWRKLLYPPSLMRLLLIALLAGAGWYLFTGWRARDLAAKARENFEKGNYRMAWLQLQSARELRAGDSEVLRAGALLEAGFGRPEALASLQELESRGPLGKDDLREKARVAMRFGTEDEFEQAVRKLEATGAGDDTAPLRTARAVLRGDLDRAIAEARRAAESAGRPDAKLELVRLLGQRHGHMLRHYGRPSAEDLPALREIVEIIDSLQSGELAAPALALGLGALAPDEQTKKRWAEAAMKNVDPANPALLPAAEHLVRSGASTAAEMQARLRPLYDTAPLDQRADFALWLSRQGLPKEGLTMITAQEAAQDPSAFLARTDAMARLGNWQGVLDTTESAQRIPASMLQLTRVWVAVNAGDPAGMRAAFDRAVASAVQAAAREKQLRPMLESLDSIGAGAAADAELDRLCANPEMADAAFTLLRERVGASAGTAALEPAYLRARAAAPGAPPVIDHGRYLAILAGLHAEPADTAAAIASHPSEIAPRITHALLMLRRGDPAAAKAAFEDITVFFDRMIPAHQAVVASFTAGTGDAELARLMKGKIDTDVLTPGEVAVLDQWVPAEAPVNSP